MIDWGDVPAGRAFAVVLGRAGADGAYRALDAGSTVVVDAPKLCGPGWWLLEADVTTSGLEAVAAALAGETAVVLVADAAAYGVVSTFDSVLGVAESSFGELEPVGMLAEPRAVSRARVDQWLMANAPKHPSQRSVTRAWDDLEGGKGREVAVALLKRWGWRYTGVGPTSLLDGCEGVSPGTHRVGLTRVDWEQVRWITGTIRDEDQGTGWALWDLDHPGPPVRRWPGTKEGRDQMDQARLDLVIQPILEATVLTGERFWTPIQRHPDTLKDDVPAMLMHWSTDHGLAVLYPAPLPKTLWLNRYGFDLVPSAWATRARLDEFNGYGLANLRTVEQAQRVAYASLLNHFTDHEWDDGPSPWRSVPPKVPPQLLATCAWVREQT